MQRLPTLTSARWTHADRHQAVVGLGRRRGLEWPLYATLLTLRVVEMVRAPAPRQRPLCYRANWKSRPKAVLREAGFEG